MNFLSTPNCAPVLHFVCKFLTLNHITRDLKINQNLDTEFDIFNLIRLKPIKKQNKRSGEKQRKQILTFKSGIY